MNECPRILVVDDDASILRATSRILKSAGYAVIEASSGAEALRLAQEQSPDLILLDVVLADLGGVEVCRRIKADPARARPFVVLLSGVKTDSDSRAHGLEVGADGYIVRPIANRELVARVQALLRIKAAEDALRASVQKYRCLFENMTSGFVILEACRDQAQNIVDFRYVEVNQATQKITGLAAEAMVGKTLTEVLGDKVHMPTVNLYKQVLTSGESAQSEIYTPFLQKYIELYIFRADENRIAVIYNDITERKRTEDAVRALSARHQAMLAAVPDIIMEVDKNKVYTWANRAGMEFFGADVIGKEAAFYFEGEQETYQIVQPLFSGNEDVIYVESWQRRHDGEKRLLAWWCRTLKDAQGNVTGALSTARDITKRRRAEEALAVSETRYRRLFEAARDGILILDAETGMIVDVNPFLIKMLGFPREQFLEKRIWELGFFKDIAANRTSFEELQRQEYIRYGNLPLETGDGRQIKVEFVSNVYWVNHQKVIQCNIRNITERKRAEEALRESEARFRVIFEQAAVGVAQVNAQTGAYLQINQKHCDIVGYTREEMLQKTFQDITHPDDLQSDLDQMKRLREGEIRSFTMEKRYFRKDGSIVWINLTVSPMWQPGDAPNYQIAIVEDITARKRAEAALQEYSERLEQMVEERTSELRDAQEQLLRQERLTMLGQIAGGIGHELRAPLGGIKNAVYLLNLTLKSPDPDTQETLQILKRQVTMAERVITSLLDFARPEPPYRRETNLYETIDAALGQITIPENVTLIRQFGAALPALSVDPDQLQIVFGNLIRNAIQAMAEGGQLTIEARWLDDQVSIAFHDTGVGIAPDVLDKIFQPLFSTRSRGMGLGLALCKLLVEGHNGKISVTSQVGAGTTFVIDLPVS